MSELVNFQKLNFHRKVDVLVAIHVMKWDKIDIIENKDNFIIFEKDKTHYWCTGIPKEETKPTGVPCYSTLLTCAWDIVREFDYVYLFRGGGKLRKGLWKCKLIHEEDYDYGDDYVSAETELLAICYAGLKAVGFDVEKFLKEEEKV